jgi:hypothetical protein
MTSVVTLFRDFYVGKRHPARFKVAIALVVAGLADWLFYHGDGVGISVVLFVVALMCGSLLANSDGLDRKRATLATIIFLAGLVPAIEDLNLLSFLFIFLGLGLSIAILTNPNLERPGDWLRALRDLLLIGPLRSIGEAKALFNLPVPWAGVVVWFVPLALGAVFVFLFAAANPLIERWLAPLDLGRAISHFDVVRILFWIIALLVIWPYIRLRWRRRVYIAVDAIAADSHQSEAGGDNAQDLSANAFDAAAILRSLILFNVLFAVPTVLDLIYLWGDRKLPADITYADYAHRGAYTLIITALLAGGFVLIAMRPGSPAEASRTIRPLVYLWLAQNVVLVASSVQRLHVYVEIYSLTYWRVAAFVWMLLVAIGLALIVLRIMFNRSNEWLIGMNLISSTATVYICALINFAGFVGEYNVTHVPESARNDLRLDVHYLVDLGPQALPAIDKAPQIPGNYQFLADGRMTLVEEQRRIMASWRSWGFRSFRLQRYLDGRQNRPNSG